MTQKLEETVAHLLLQVEELSQITARQDQEIMQLSKKLGLLVERAAREDATGGGGVIVGDERPPHY